MQQGHGGKLSRKQEQAVSALLSQPTIESAARAAGVSHKTLKRWLRDADFSAAFAAARRGLLEASVVRLVAVCGEAVQTLQESLQADRTADRIRSAALILEFAAKGTELLDLESRLSALERAHRARRRAAK
jgi:hypothetical protein